MWIKKYFKLHLYWTLILLNRFTYIREIYVYYFFMRDYSAYMIDVDTMNLKSILKFDRSNFQISKFQIKAKFKG